jgi:hypothetical protein
MSILCQTLYYGLYYTPKLLDDNLSFLQAITDRRKDIMQHVTIMVFQEGNYVEFTLTDIIKSIFQAALADASTRNVFCISVFGQNIEKNWKIFEEQWKDYQKIQGVADNNLYIGFPDFWYGKLNFLKMHIIKTVGIHRYQGYPALRVALLELAKMNGIHDLK